MWANFESAVCKHASISGIEKTRSRGAGQAFPDSTTGPLTRPITGRMNGMRGCHPRKWFAGPSPVGRQTHAYR